ncbi:MAG: flagellar export chaperone FliS [Sinobacteraceae bacterium]|nr:flagellar export chaperone FliS [Nevskiaceae bacterium]MBV8854400.1 flagellar export chaperone FliS [Nevskiaceae bacterium]
MSSYARPSKLAAYQTVAVHGGVANADPHAMVLMLLDAGMERLAIARGCAERRELKRQAALLHSCVQIITELRGSLNLAQGGPLATNLNDLYEYMIRRLVLANSRGEATGIAEVAGLLEEIRSAWIAIGPEVRKAAQVKAQPAPPPPAAAGFAGARHG